MIKSRSTNQYHYKKTLFPSSLYAILFLLLILITSSEAQVPSYQDTIIPIPHPVTSLLRSKKVHRELRLSTAEVNEVQKVVSEFDLPLWRLRDLPLQKRNEAAAPFINQLKSKLVPILSDRQMERLNQLVWQAMGINVILEPQVSLKLNLSPAQTIRIRTLLKTLSSQIRNSFPAG